MERTKLCARRTKTHPLLWMSWSARFSASTLPLSIKSSCSNLVSGRSNNLNMWPLLPSWSCPHGMRCQTRSWTDSSSAPDSLNFAEILSQIDQFLDDGFQSDVNREFPTKFSPFLVESYRNREEAVSETFNRILSEGNFRNAYRSDRFRTAMNDLGWLHLYGEQRM